MLPSVITTLCTNIFVPPNIFDKPTPVSGTPVCCQLVTSDEENQLAKLFAWTLEFTDGYFLYRASFACGRVLRHRPELTRGLGWSRNISALTMTIQNANR